MAEYVYEGPGPVTDPEGEIVHPGDVREFSEEPAWGPWRELEPASPLASPAVTTQPAPPPPKPATVTDLPPVTAPTLPATGTEGK